MKVLTDVEFNDFVKNNKVAVIDFYADWCGPCQMLKPIMEELSEELKDKAAIAKINVDDNKEHAQKYGVMSIPTVLIFKDGELADKFMGAMPKDAVKEKIEKFF